MKHLFVSISVKQNLFVHKCLMMLNDVEYTTFKMFVTQMNNYLFVISFQLMFYKTLRYLNTQGGNLKKSEQGGSVYFFESEIWLKFTFLSEKKCNYFFGFQIFELFFWGH